MLKRKTRWKIWYIGLTVSFSFPGLTCLSQQVQTFTDKHDILIGEQVKLKVKTTLPPGFNRQFSWFSVPDSIPHFEIVETGKADTVSYKDDSKAIEQTIIFTSFDSGRWAFPQLMLNFKPAKGDTTFTLFTDSVIVNVSYAPPDSTNRLRDIKPIIKVSVTSYLWYYIGGGMLLLLVAAFFLWRYFKNKKKEPVITFSSKLSPYDEAMQNLAKLQQLDLEEANDIKLFHSRLAAIFKWYISRRKKVSIMNMTTGDTLIYLGENNLSNEVITATATVLRCGDAVKFAKYIPSAAESNECLEKIRTIINILQPQTKN